MLFLRRFGSFLGGCSLFAGLCAVEIILKLAVIEADFGLLDLGLFETVVHGSEKNSHVFRLAILNQGHDLLIADHIGERDQQFDSCCPYFLVGVFEVGDGPLHDLFVGLF